MLFYHSACTTIPATFSFGSCLACDTPFELTGNNTHKMQGRRLRFIILAGKAKRKAVQFFYE